ncbi:MAG: Ku protein [Actinobacteria bacterium]|nr:Ku protein [Actinomycetota bacterium]
MPRAIWSGSISFGLVNVPVKLYSAVSSQSLGFHQLVAEEDGYSRVRQKRVSGRTGEEVPYDEIKKGYELSPGQYVVIDPDELEALDPDASRTIDIEDFVDLDDIDPMFYDRPYYLGPADAAANKPYRLLVEAMKDTNKVAIARFVMRTKQYLAAIRAKDGLLVLETMNYADEIVPAEEVDGVPAPEEVEIKDRELDMARQLVESLATAFEPEKYEDTYRLQVLDLIERKAAGEEIAVEPSVEEPEKVVDLMAALEESINAAQQRKQAG